MLDVTGGRLARDFRGGPARSCDGVTRRGFLRAGALGLGGLTLARALESRADALAGGGPTNNTAVIQVFLFGGPSHIDTFDPKPNAPREVRGELGAIQTAIPGVHFSELLPNLAGIADKLAIVRGLHHDTPDHNMGTHWAMTGFAPATNFLQTNDRPSAGAIAAKLRGPNAAGVPPYVGLPRAPFFGGASYLGSGYNPFAVNGDPNGEIRVPNLEPAGHLTLDRLADRRGLLAELDKIERARDGSGMMDGVDHFTAQAYEMVTGPAARRAFDLEREDPRLRDRYGRSALGQSLLLARRLVEAGVTFVTVTDFDNWDHHNALFASMRDQLPKLDAAVPALVEDLHARGLADRVLVLVWGEFGRTPRLTGGGRDHWPGAMSALMAGGGLRTGQVIGATGLKGESPTERPTRPEDVLQTVYRVLDIDPLHEFPDETGRPRPVLDRGAVISELV